MRIAVHVRFPETVDVKAIRKRLGLTQAAFVQRYGFDSSIRNWEHAHISQEPARLLRLVIDKEPEGYTVPWPAGVVESIRPLHTAGVPRRGLTGLWPGLSFTYSTAREGLSQPSSPCPPCSSPPAEAPAEG